MSHRSCIMEHVLYQVRTFIQAGLSVINYKKISVFLYLLPNPCNPHPLLLLYVSCIRRASVFQQVHNCVCAARREQRGNLSSSGRLAHTLPLAQEQSTAERTEGPPVSKLHHYEHINHVSVRDPGYSRVTAALD